MESALLEASVGVPERARELFARGAAIVPPHSPLLAAAAAFEAKQGNDEAAAAWRARAEAAELVSARAPPSDGRSADLLPVSLGGV